MIELYLSQDEWRTWVHLMETLHEKSGAATVDDGDIFTVEDANSVDDGYVSYTRSAAAIRDFGSAQAAREDADREAGRSWNE